MIKSNKTAPIKINLVVFKVLSNMKILLDLGFKVPYATAKYPINLNYIKNVKEQNLEDRYKVCFSVKPFLSCKYSTS